MNIEEQQQHLQNILSGIEEIQAAVDGMTYESFRQEEQVKEDVYMKLQMVGEAAYELSNASDTVEGLNFSTDLLSEFRNARYNEEAEVSHQQVWGIIQQDFPEIHDQIVSDAAELSRAE